MTIGCKAFIQKVIQLVQRQQPSLRMLSDLLDDTIQLPSDSPLQDHTNFLITLADLAYLCPELSADLAEQSMSMLLDNLQQRLLRESSGWTLGLYHLLATHYLQSIPTSPQRHALLLEFQSLSVECMAYGVHTKGQHERGFRAMQIVALKTLRNLQVESTRKLLDLLAKVAGMHDQVALAVLVFVRDEVTGKGWSEWSVGVQHAVLKLAYGMILAGKASSSVQSEAVRLLAVPQVFRTVLSLPNLMEALLKWAMDVLVQDMEGIGLKMSVLAFLMRFVHALCGVIKLQKAAGCEKGGDVFVYQRIMERVLDAECMRQVQIATVDAYGVYLRKYDLVPSHALA